MSETPTTYRVAVMGGTGPQGKGLGYRFARAGHDVILGSRAAEKAVPVAGEVTERLAGVEGAGTVTGAANADAGTDDPLSDARSDCGAE